MDSERLEAMRGRFDALKVSVARTGAPRSALLKEIREGSVHGETVRVLGFVSGIRATGKKNVFLILRDGFDTLQCIASRGSHEEPREEPLLGNGAVLMKEDLGQIRAIPTETYVEVEGTVVDSLSKIVSCSISTKELRVERVRIITLANANLPFLIKDASRTVEEKRECSALANVAFSKRLDWRFLDLRTPQTHAIFKVYSATLDAFRCFFRENGFMEIKTPKIIGGASEGGADMFGVSYFGSQVALAQSPQLYKQMAILGGFKRVFEISPCFRAENSNTGRHLTEFTGVDLEMEIEPGTYIDLIQTIHNLLAHVFRAVTRDCEEELAVIQKYVPHSNKFAFTESPVLLSFKDAVDVLKSLGREAASYAEDLSTEDERELGAYVREHFGTDIFVVSNYPSSVRPFYTSTCEDDPAFTKSFDFIFRGEEILSGAQRINDHKALVGRISALGVSTAGLADYIEAFSFGAPPHGGCGIGLERVVKLICGVSDIHLCSMFPRDPGRVKP